MHMQFHIDLLFRSGKGYDDLVSRIGENPRYVFGIHKQDQRDKRTRKGRQKGWAEIRHRQHAGVIKLVKDEGVCRACVEDESGGLKLIGAWTSWLASRTSDLIYGIDIRIE
jgi:hypothetical protein